MKKAFTMVEIIFVIVVLGILASIGLTRLSATRDDAEVATSVQKLSHLISDIGSYYTANGTYDTNLSSMTNVILVDSSNNIFTGNLMTTPAYFANSARTKLCFKIVLNDSNGTLTVRDENEGSSYCRALSKMAANLITTHSFGGSTIFK